MFAIQNDTTRADWPLYVPPGQTGVTVIVTTSIRKSALTDHRGAFFPTTVEDVAERGRGGGRGSGGRRVRVIAGRGAHGQRRTFR